MKGIVHRRCSAGCELRRFFIIDHCNDEKTLSQYAKILDTDEVCSEPKVLA